MPVKDRVPIPPSLQNYYRIDPAPLRVNSGNFQHSNEFQSTFNTETKNCETAAPKWPNYSNVGPNAFKVNSGNTQNNRVFPFKFSAPTEKKSNIAATTPTRSYGAEPTLIPFSSGSSQESSDFQFTFKMPRHNLTTTPQWPAPVASASSTINSEYPQGQTSDNLKADSEKPSVYIFKGSNSPIEKSVAGLARLVSPTFHAAAFSDEKENSGSSKPFNFNLGASTPFDVKGALKRPSLANFGSSAFSSEKFKSRTSMSTASKAFDFTGRVENKCRPHPVTRAYELSSSSKEKNNTERPAPFTFGGSIPKNQGAAASRIVPFTFTLSAPPDVKIKSGLPAGDISRACTVDDGKTSTPPPAQFTFGASPDEKGTSNRPAPFTFRGSTSDENEENLNASKIVPFTFSLSTPPVEKERTSIPQLFRFGSRVPASSNQTRNLKLTLPAPLIFKPSTSPEMKEHARPPKPLASVFNESSLVHQASLISRSASSSQTTNSPSHRSSIESKETQELLAQGICMSVLRSPSNMCALRRGRRSQYAAEHPSQSTNDATKQAMGHTVERQRNSSEETRLLFSSFATVTSPHSPLSSKRKHETVYPLQDVPTTDNLQENEHIPKRRCDIFNTQKHLDSSWDTQTSSSFHTPTSLNRKREVIPSIHGVPATELPSYWTNSNSGEVSQQLPLHPVMDELQQEESPTVKRRRDSCNEQEVVEYDRESAAKESTFAKFSSTSNDPASHSSISDISFAFVPATNFFQTEKLKPGFLASPALEYTTEEQEKRSSGADTFTKDQDASCDTEIIYAGQKRKERDNDDYVPAFKRLRTIISSFEKNLDMATDGHLKSTTGESICYIERKPTADQKAWLQNQDTLHEKDVISMAIRDKSDQHDNKTLLVMLQEESSQQLNEDSSKKTTLEHVNKSLIKLDSGYHEYDEDHHDTKASSESSGPIDRSMRTPSPPPRRKIIPPATLEKRTISTVEDLFKELEEEEEYIKEDAVYADEDDGRELIFVHREFKIRTGTLITDHRWALDDSSSSGEEETLCQTRSQPRNLFPSEEYQRTLDDNDKKDEIDDFFMSM